MTDDEPMTDAQDVRDAVRAGYIDSDDVYCCHGTFTGTALGPDYICGLCEEGAPCPEEEIATKTTTVDITPTWAGLVPALCAVLENPDPAAEGSKYAIRQELLKMARAADRYNERVREGR